MSADAGTPQGGTGDVGRRARQAGRQIERSPWIERMGRAGFAAMGVSYALVALLALEVAFGLGGRTTGPKGALQTVAHKPFGKALLILLAVGFLGYAAWRAVQAILDRDDEGDDAGGLATRAGYLGRALAYAALFVSTVSIIAGSGGSSHRKAQTATVLGWPGGRWIVGVIGLAALAFAAYNAYYAVTRRFLESKFDRARLTPDAQRWATRVGIAGYAARAVVASLIGIFVIKAALDYKPKDAIGLDGALAKLAHQSYGSWLLGTVAAGLLLYGVYCELLARYGRV